MSLIQEDYIMRMVEMAAQVIARALGLAKQGASAAALAVIEDGIDELLGERRNIIEMLDPVSAAHLLGDARLVQAYADLLRKRSECDDTFSPKGMEHLNLRLDQLLLEARRMAVSKPPGSGG